MNILLLIGGIIISLFAIVMCIINIFKPTLFEINGNEYIPRYGRYILFLLQIILFLIVSIISLIFFVIDKKNTNRYRCLSIGLFGLFMALSIVGQLFYPLLPVYSTGCIISNCMIHVFVVSSEKEEVLRELQASLNREYQREKELDLTKSLVYIDPLTGAKSKHAFVEIEAKIDKLISNKKIDSFSIVVFDVNGLKIINDTKGHEFGDIYIKDSYNIIKEIYKDTEVYRFGGDEFVAILIGKDFDNRDELLKEFNNIIDNNIIEDKPVVSIGMSDFDIFRDNTFNAVFIRADEKMYIRKRLLKSQNSDMREY